MKLAFWIKKRELSRTWRAFVYTYFKLLYSFEHNVLNKTLILLKAGLL